MGSGEVSGSRGGRSRRVVRFSWGLISHKVKTSPRYGAPVNPASSSSSWREVTGRPGRKERGDLRKVKGEGEVTGGRM